MGGLEKEHIGELAIARVLGFKKDPIYKILVKVESGNLKNNACFVAYKGETKEIKTNNILIRVDIPYVKQGSSKMKFNQADFSGHFITSDIPDGFDYALSNEIIFYGIWNDYMKKGFRIPIIPRVIEYYNPGFLPKVLHCIEEFKYVIFYELVNGRNPVKVINEEGIPRGFESALKRHLNNVRKNDSKVPCVVTIDENVNFEKRILPEFEKTNLKYFVKLEPQQ